MKKFLAAALALSLLGSSAAIAAPHGHGGHGNFGGNRNFGHSDHRGNDGALIAGVGLFALAAILATSQSHNDRPQPYYDDYRAPPPPPAYGPDYNRDYAPGYWGR